MSCKVLPPGGRSGFAARASGVAPGRRLAAARSRPPMPPGRQLPGWRKWNGSAAPAAFEQAHAAGLREGEAPGRQQAAAEIAAGHGPAGAFHRGNRPACGRGLRREAEADLVAAGARHRPARAAPRAGGRSRGAARLVLGGARKTAGAARSTACGCTPRTAPLVRPHACAEAGAIRPWRWSRTGARAGRAWSSKPSAAIWTPPWRRNFGRSSAAWRTACGSGQ